MTVLTVVVCRVTYLPNSIKQILGKITNLDIRFIWQTLHHHKLLLAKKKELVNNYTTILCLGMQMIWWWNLVVILMGLLQRVKLITLRKTECSILFTNGITTMCTQPTTKRMLRCMNLLNISIWSHTINSRHLSIFQSAKTWFSMNSKYPTKSLHKYISRSLRSMLIIHYTHLWFFHISLNKQNIWKLHHSTATCSSRKLQPWHPIKKYIYS